MRSVQRPLLPKKIQTYLAEKHKVAVQRKKAGELDIDALWKKSRQTKNVGRAFVLLQKAMGTRERCMYCLDAHATDIEHFKPKAKYPLYAFKWTNWLVCCAECGRFKGSGFPMQNYRPLLIDPTVENPWTHIDFDPATGNLMARFDVAKEDWSRKGVETIKVLHLDRREALASGYQNTYKRLATIVNSALSAPQPKAQELAKELLEADDHGLLEWCFCYAGQQEAPFLLLKQKFSDLWEDCITVLKYQ